MKDGLDTHVHAADCILLGIVHLRSLGKWDERERQEWIVQRVNDGWTYAEVARTLGVQASHVRTVYRSLRTFASRGTPPT